MLERIEEISDFVSSHSELFDPFETMYIKGYLKEVKEGRHDIFLPDLMRELFDHFQILSDDQDIYKGFVDMLQENFSMEDANILEVGGGIFPELARRISLLQNRGRITVYDPRLSVYEAGNTRMILVRKNFSQYDSLGLTDLMIGFMPCKGAEDLVSSATKNGVDFMVALCEGGLHGDIYDYFESDQEWIDSMLYRAERGISEHNMGSLVVEYLDQYEDPYPVIYNKRK